ncbi:hypothetical protein ACRALDRAFT_1079042 [Sodiomyces alcalophilus JCM 7366]|uniref:uncharacterized protein n=1 Tax=Sodiomyces alcalophilus JCM 7366 TaxID=591952 RepID=UPI0039B67098
MDAQRVIMLARIRRMFRPRAGEPPDHRAAVKRPPDGRPVMNAESSKAPAPPRAKSPVPRLPPPQVRIKPQAHDQHMNRPSSREDLREIAPAMPEEPPSDEDKRACKEAVASIFPDICPDYLEETASQHGFDQEAIIDHILDLVDRGAAYKKRPKMVQRKRKRSNSKQTDELKAYISRFDNPARKMTNKDPAYYAMSKSVLRWEFPRARHQDVALLLAQNGHLLLPAYLALHKAFASRDWDGGHGFAQLNAEQRLTSQDLPFTPRRLDATIAASSVPAEKEALEELQAARWVVQRLAAKRAVADKKKQEDEENLARAKAEGTMMECGCCFGDFPMNCMVYCNSDVAHWFCIGCAKRNAETVVGMSKYELKCLSTGGCSANFPADQRKIFLDKKLTAALDRIETETVLRMAGITNLETCPACPYAAEYPPVTEDKEFRCGNSECLLVSCRLCKEESHIPKSCAEAARERGIPARRQIEEAMSSALIRKCNKCHIPFVKTGGCNKMTCPQKGCGNVQCYVCSESCTYDHFNDEDRGGKEGNCPLFDSQEARHDQEVRRAEERARRKVLAENPVVDPELLQIHVSKRVEMEDRRRRHISDARHYQEPGVADMRLAGPGPPRNPFIADHFIRDAHPYPEAANVPLAGPAGQAQRRNGPPRRHRAPGAHRPNPHVLPF